MRRVPLNMRCSRKCARPVLPGSSRNNPTVRAKRKRMATPLNAPLRAGIVGYGFAGRGFHAYLLRHEPRIRLAAVASRDPGRRARAESDYGIPTYETLAQLLDSEA